MSKSDIYISFDDNEFTS